MQQRLRRLLFSCVLLGGVWAAVPTEYGLVTVRDADKRVIRRYEISAADYDALGKKGAQHPRGVSFEDWRTNRAIATRHVRSRWATLRRWIDPSVEAAIAVEGSITLIDGEAESSNGLTFAHTTTAATGIFVGIATANGATDGVTFDGEALTELWDVQEVALGLYSAGYLKVDSVNVGTLNVVVDLAGAGSFTHNAGAIGITGIETSSVAAAHRTVYTVNNACPPSVTVVDSQSGDLVVDTAVGEAPIAVGAGQTGAEDELVFGSGWSMGISHEAASGASTVMSWTGPAQFCSIGATALIPATAGGSTCKGSMLLGFAGC